MIDGGNWQLFAKKNFVKLFAKNITQNTNEFTETRNFRKLRQNKTL